MSKRRHHFVPRLYLKAFGSSEKQIHIFNLARELAIQNASLRDQCYKHKFYGETDDLEDFLAEIETRVAPILKSIQKDQSLPKRGSEDHAYLFVFIAMQILRTQATASRVNMSADKLTK